MLSKHKRKFYKKIPIVFFVLILVSLIFLSVFLISKKSTNNSFLSPLSKASVYKENSVEDLLSKKNIQFEKVLVATDSSYLIFLKDQGQVLISSKKNIQPQISSLQLILSRLTIEGKKFKKLDLRFERSIIEF